MIKKESGPERKFETGARKQNAKGKGTPVLFPGDAYLEISKHFEDGAGHYGARNWEKGIPLSKLIDSLERHIAQEKMGLTDESHDRALAWNAVVYLATKLRIKAGILPKELNDLEAAYIKSMITKSSEWRVRRGSHNPHYWYVCDGDSYNTTKNWMENSDGCGFFSTQLEAQAVLDAHNAKNAETKPGYGDVEHVCITCEHTKTFTNDEPCRDCCPRSEHPKWESKK